MPYKTREQKTEYQRRWKQARRTEWIEANGPCRRCGSPEDLEVDHIDASLKTTSDIFSLRSDLREKELANCQVLCDTCHKIKTREAGDNGFLGLRHGTLNGYNYWKCRCPECRAAVAAWVRENRQAKKIALAETKSA